MQLKSISLGQDGNYVATLDGDQDDHVSLVSMSLGELHTMIHDCVTDLECLHDADRVFDEFLEQLIQDAVIKLNTLHAKFGSIAA